MTSPLLDLGAIRGEVSGRVLEPGDQDYDAARTVFYGGFDHRPGAIVRAADAEDVARAATMAADAGVDLAVRSGGHSLAGHSTTDGGMVIDLSDMRGLTIDPVARTAWAQAGLTTGEYTRAAGVHGLATGFGDTGSVGLGGITTSGGIGFLTRKHGLTIDSVLAAEVVTAEGRVVRTDPDTNPDLFWAIRGGGGNFGVVTRFQYRLHDVSEVVGGMIILPASPEVVAGFLAEAEDAPEELSTIANVGVAPPLPFLPEEVHGQLVLMGLVAFTGNVAEGEKAMGRFRNLAQPIMDAMKPLRYPELFVEPESEEEYHPTAASKNMFMDRFGLADAKTVIRHIEESTAMAAVTQLRVLGGAAARVAADSTAFAHRDRKIMANIAALYQDPAEQESHAEWVQNLAGALRQDEDGAYVGFVGPEGEAGARRAYPEPTWQRLREVKRRYDPENLFRMNHNIPPA